MRPFLLFTVAATLLTTFLATAPPPARAQPKGATPAEAQAGAARYAAADIRVLVPGIVYEGGVVDLASAYTKQTGKKVAVSAAIMGNLVNLTKTADPPADVIMLPLELMSTLSLDGGIAPGTFTPLGRSQMGLAVKAGAPHPDISTIEKLATALRGAQNVMRSNPAGGSMVAKIIEDRVIKRPEFAGVKSTISTQGEGGQALARGEGDMAIQTICQILPYKTIELVGPLPVELGVWIDTATAVSARAAHRDDGLAFIKYILRPESSAVWKSKGFERFN
jgi:molybdate transport system substrate-binding protein